MTGSPSDADPTDTPTAPPHRLRPPLAWSILVKGIAAFLRVGFGWRYRATVSGDVPPAGTPLVVVVNHTGRLEPFLQAYTVWRRTGHWVQPLAKSELFDIPVLSFLGRHAGGIPVYRESDTGRGNAYAAAIACLQSGGAVYVAPEGTITHDGELLPLRQGAARLAIEAGAPVLVSTSFGGQRAFSPVVRRPDRGALFDVHMEMLHLDPDEDAAQLTGRIAATMMDRSAALREAYPDADPTARWWPPYKEPAEPSRTGAESLSKYRASMAEAVEHARDRMLALAEEREAAGHRPLAERARAAAGHARSRAEELGEQLRHRAEELAELARSGELTEQVRHLAEELATHARGLGEQLAAQRHADPDTGPDADATADAPTEPTAEAAEAGAPGDEVVQGARDVTA